MGLIIVALPISWLVILVAAIIVIVSGNVAPRFAVSIAMAIIRRSVRIRGIRVGIRIRMRRIRMLVVV